MDPALRRPADGQRRQGPPAARPAAWRPYRRAVRACAALEPEVERPRGPAMLKRISIDNYRCFVGFELRPGRRNLLIGDNGTGKTSLFDALGAIQDLLIFESSVEDAFPAVTLARATGSSRQRFELEIEGPRGTLIYELVIVQDPETEETRISSEHLSLNGLPLYGSTPFGVELRQEDPASTSAFPYNSKRSFIAAVEAKRLHRDVVWFKDFVQGIWILKIDPRGVVASSRLDSQWLSRDAVNFAAWYRFISDEEPSVTSAALTALKEIMPGLRHLKKVASGRAKVLAAEFSFAGQPAYTVDFDNLSDGQRALIILYTVLHAVMSRATVMCFDEPDNFVAIAEIQPWLVTMLDVLDTPRDGGGRQCLLISHSREIIDFLGHADAVRLARDESGHVCVRPVPMPVGITLSDELVRGVDDGT